MAHGDFARVRSNQRACVYHLQLPNTATCIANMSRQLLMHWSDLQRAQTELLSCATSSIAVFDRDLSRLSLGSPAIDEVLRRFLSSQRQSTIRIALHDTSRALNNNPRLVVLLNEYGHQLTIREIPDNLRHLADEMLIVDNSHAVIHFQFDQPRAKQLVEETDELGPYVRRFEDLWLECGPPVSATRLGL